MGMWNVPPDYNPVDNPQGHICNDIISRGNDDINLIRNLDYRAMLRPIPISLDITTDLFGKAVKGSNGNLGSLCVLYQKDYVPDDADSRFSVLSPPPLALKRSEKKYRRKAPALSWAWSAPERRFS